MEQDKISHHEKGKLSVHNYKSVPCIILRYAYQQQQKGNDGTHYKMYKVQSEHI
jgi:hypothetical protein